MLLYILTGGITVLTVGLRISSLVRTVFCAVLITLLLGALLDRRLPKTKKNLLSVPGVIGVTLFVLALITPPLPAALLMLLAPLSEVFFSASAAALLALLCRKSA